MLNKQAKAGFSVRMLGAACLVVVSMTCGLRANAQSAATQDNFGQNLPSTNTTNQLQQNAQNAQNTQNNPVPGNTPGTVGGRSTFTQFNSYNNNGNWQPGNVLTPAQQQANLNAQNGSGGAYQARVPMTGSSGGGGGGGGGGAGSFDAFSMLQMYATSACDIQHNYANAYPWEKIRMQQAVTQTMQSNEQPEKFGGVSHSGERTTIVPPVVLPVGQCNAQQAVPGGPGFASKGAENFYNDMMKRVTVNGQPLHNSMGRPLTDGSAHALKAMGDDIKGQLQASPAHAMRSAQVGQQAKMQRASDAAADAGEHTLAGGLDTMLDEGLINVANENAGTPTSSEALTKTRSQCIWMVQQMYKRCYIYMAILLLLPGAMITHMKSLVSYGLLSTAEDAESREISPFTAIMRSTVAIFLIPATQLILSWCVDIGNSAQYEVAQLTQPTALFEWAKEQYFNPPPQNAANQLIPPKASAYTSNNSKLGKLHNISEKQSEVETQTDVSRMVCMMFNFMNIGLSAALVAICTFQVAMICYLFLLGPIAAAFYAWPSGVGSLFNKVISNWIDAVINVSLWRFWWCVVVLCMCTRIQWLQESGTYQPTSQWEMMMFTAFQVILVYVPFVPFEFRPGDFVDKISEKAKESSSQATSGGGGGSGGGNSSGGHGNSGGNNAGGHTAGNKPHGGGRQSHTNPAKH